MFVFSQAVELGNRERLIAFCEVVQQTCPVGSFIKPTAGETPGYASEVWLCAYSSINVCILFYYF
jgi:cystathionine beta-lyase family protein involved in aluminum resistance